MPSQSIILLVSYLLTRSAQYNESVCKLCECPAHLLCWTITAFVINALHLVLIFSYINKLLHQIRNTFSMATIRLGMPKGSLMSGPLIELYKIGHAFCCHTQSHVPCSKPGLFPYIGIWGFRRTCLSVPYKSLHGNSQVWQLLLRKLFTEEKGTERRGNNAVGPVSLHSMRRIWRLRWRA